MPGQNNRCCWDLRVQIIIHYRGLRDKYYEDNPFCGNHEKRNKIDVTKQDLKAYT
jgi:hypothetical protein